MKWICEIERAQFINGKTEEKQKLFLSRRIEGFEFLFDVSYGFIKKML